MNSRHEVDKGLDSLSISTAGGFERDGAVFRRGEKNEDKNTFHGHHHCYIYNSPRMDDPSRKTATVAIKEPRKLGNLDQIRSSRLL